MTLQHKLSLNKCKTPSQYDKFATIYVEKGHNLVYRHTLYTKNDISLKLISETSHKSSEKKYGAFSQIIRGEQTDLVQYVLIFKWCIADY